MGVHVTVIVFWLFFFFFQIIETFQYLVVASHVLQSHIQRRVVDDSGFISIDCGLPTGSYYDPSNGLFYTSDEKYISTGRTFEIASDFYETDHQDLHKTLRSFPEGLRNCYSLSPLKPNNTYLIRTRFMYGNYDGKNTFPAFDVYIGVNLWFRLTLSSASDHPSYDIVHLATSESIDVCLVNTGTGTPFISALELRPVDNSSFPASVAFSLQTWSHEDVGRTSYLDQYIEWNGDDRDAYDRQWFSNTSAWLGWEFINMSNKFDASQDNHLKVPTSVLKTAVVQNGSLVNFSRQLNRNGPATQCYVYWHFAELELLGSNQSREFNIFVPGYNKIGPVSPKYLQVTTISSPRISLNDTRVLTCTLEKTNESTHYPILNGVEIYTVLELPASPTNQEDARAISAIKDKHTIGRIWQGDPCLPKNYQWEGLNCTYDANNPPRISSLNLSSSNLTGDLPPSLLNLTSLKHLNLSNNGLTGRIPRYLAHMPLLHVIDLSGNNLSGPVPQELIEKASNKTIDLRLQGNPDICKSYPCEVKSEANKKRRHHFIIPLAITCVVFVSLSLLVITGTIFRASKRTKKQEGLVDQTIRSRSEQFNFSDIVRITDNFKKVLGKGGFGTVYDGLLQDGTQVAVKVLNDASSAITLKQFCVEAELLTRVHHVNLVSLIGYCDEHANMALVYEFMSCGDLQMHLSGLEYLHSGCRPPIVHRDIKPANILLDAMGRAKIADFGLSRLFITNSQGGVVSTDFAGTRGYLDPEYCRLISSLSEKSDVYAFGIVLLQLLTGKPALIKKTNDEDDIVHIHNWVSSIIESGDILAIVDKGLQGDLDVNFAWKFLEIALECAKPTGSQRPRMSEVVADLKICYASEEKKNASFDGDNGTYYNSSQAFDSSIATLPNAR